VRPAWTPGIVRAAPAAVSAPAVHVHDQTRDVRPAWTPRVDCCRLRLCLRRALS